MEMIYHLFGKTAFNILYNKIHNNPSEAQKNYWNQLEEVISRDYSDILINPDNIHDILNNPVQTLGTASHDTTGTLDSNQPDDLQPRDAQDDSTKPDNIPPDYNSQNNDNEIEKLSDQQIQEMIAEWLAYKNITYPDAKTEGNEVNPSYDFALTPSNIHESHSENTIIGEIFSDFFEQDGKTEKQINENSLRNANISVFNKNEK